MRSPNKTGRRRDTSPSILVPGLVLFDAFLLFFRGGTVGVDAVGAEGD
jgi:hypothetical protein